MKKILLIAALFGTLSVQAQYDLKTTQLHCNNMNMRTDLYTSLAAFPATDKVGGLAVDPTDDSTLRVMSVYSSTINITAEQVNGIVGHADLYPSGMRVISGPYETGTTPDPEFEKFWTVRDWEILALLEDYNDNGTIDITPSENILKWPGRGNLFSTALEGIEWPDRDLAPFFDRNNDGIYNPYDGDYPLMDPSCPEKIPAEMIWVIFHVLSSKFEFHKLLYAFRSDSDEILNHTVFARVSTICLYDSVSGAIFSLFNDFDLGCSQDDYVGTSAADNTVYVYNQSRKDLSPCHNSGGPVNAFKIPAPIQSITCLNRNIDGSMVCYNSAIGAQFTDPDNLTEFKRYQSSIWKNGFPLTYGDTGYDSSSIQVTKFIFPDPPSDSNGWSMAHSKIIGTDPRIFLNIDLGDMSLYDRVDLDFAYTLHLADTTTDHFSNVDSMLRNIPRVRALYNDCFIPESLNQLCTGDCVWPGDTDGNGIVNNLDLLNIGVAMEKNGPSRNRFSEIWSPTSSQSWTENTDEGVNYKNIDCNGNGIINRYDVNAVSNNFLNTNTKYQQWGGFDLPGTDLTFFTNKYHYLAGEKFNCDLMLNSDDLYGLAFTVEYDPKKLKYLSHTLNSDWLDKDVAPIQITYFEEGKIHFAASKTSQNHADWVDQPMGSISFQVYDHIEDNVSATLRFNNCAKSYSGGKISPLTSTPLDIILSNALSKNQVTENDIKIFPNPADHTLHISGSHPILRAELTDLSGTGHKIGLSNNSMDTSGIYPGFYILILQDEKGNIHKKKLLIIH